MLLQSLESWLKVFLAHSAPIEDTPPFEELKVEGDKVQDLLRRGECAVLRPKAVAYQAGNSTVICSPQVDLASVLKPNEGRKVALNLVRIVGPANEDMHFHLSHVLTFVLVGRGKLLCQLPNNTEEQSLEVSAGDLIVIPRGALHIFTCEPGEEILYAAIEMAGQDVDYQKHFHRA